MIQPVPYGCRGPKMNIINKGDKIVGRGEAAGGLKLIVYFIACTA